MLPWISHRYICVFPSQTPFPPPSPSHPSGLSQCTGFECPICSRFFYVVTEMCTKCLKAKIALFMLIASYLHLPLCVLFFFFSSFMFLLSQVITFYVVSLFPKWVYVCVYIYIYFFLLLPLPFNFYIIIV